MAESSVWSSWTMSGHRNTYPNALFTPNFMVAQARSQSCTETSPSWNLFSGTEWFVIQNTVHDRTPLSPYTSERANFSDNCLAREAVHHFWYMTQHLFSQTIPTTVHTQPPWTLYPCRVFPMVGTLITQLSQWDRPQTTDPRTSHTPKLLEISVLGW